MAMREFPTLSLTAAVFSRPIQFSSAALIVKRGFMSCKKVQHSAASGKNIVSWKDLVCILNLMTHRELKEKRRELFNVEKCARKNLWSDELKERRLLELSMALLSSYDEKISSSLHFKRKESCCTQESPQQHHQQRRRPTTTSWKIIFSIPFYSCFFLYSEIVMKRGRKH